MRHPMLSTLHDYFENELNGVQSRIVKEHLLNCDQCTLILSQMAKVDTRLKNSPPSLVSDHMKNKIFSDAKSLLESKRKAIAQSEADTRAFEDWMRNMFIRIQEGVPDMRVPVFQLASLTVVIGFIVTVAQTKQVIVQKPLSEDVVVFTHIEGEVE